MTDKEKIRSEIKRLIKETNEHFDASSFYAGKESGLEQILSFIDTLPSKEEPKFKIGDTIKSKKLGVSGKVINVSDTDAIDVDCGVYKEYSIKADDWELVERLKVKPLIDIEIPFGARDSELIEETISIPNGCCAIIKDNKIIIRKEKFL